MVSGGVGMMKTGLSLLLSCVVVVFGSGGFSMILLPTMKSGWTTYCFPVSTSSNVQASPLLDITTNGPVMGRSSLRFS